MSLFGIRIYSVGVWNSTHTPLRRGKQNVLEFTPLEFETFTGKGSFSLAVGIRIYSVGVWNLLDGVEAVSKIN